MSPHAELSIFFKLVLIQFAITLQYSVHVNFYTDINTHADQCLPKQEKEKPQPGHF